MHTFILHCKKSAGGMYLFQAAAHTALYEMLNDIIDEMKSDFQWHISNMFLVVGKS